MNSILFDAEVKVLVQRREEILNPKEIKLLKEKTQQTLLFATQVANKIASKEQELVVLIPADVESLMSPVIDGVKMNEFHHIKADEFKKLFNKAEYRCEESGPCGDGYRLFLVSVG